MGRKQKARRPTKKFRQYERLLTRFQRGMLAELQQLFVKMVVPRIELLAASEKEGGFRTPQLQERTIKLVDGPNDGDSLDGLIDLVEAVHLGKFTQNHIKSNLDQFMTEMDIAAEKETRRLFESKVKAVTIAPDTTTRAVIANSVRRSTGKIMNLNDSTIGAIREKVSSGIIAGARWESIAKDIRLSMNTAGDAGTFKKAMTRAKFIARNEVGTALGAVNKERQTAVGVELYEWQTAADERVRATHSALDGRIFTWKGKVTINGKSYKEAIDPAFSMSPTIPGQPWNCRCVAIPVFPELGDLGEGAIDAPIEVQASEPTPSPARVPVPAPSTVKPKPFEPVRIREKPTNRPGEKIPLPPSNRFLKERLKQRLRELSPGVPLSFSSDISVEALEGFIASKKASDEVKRLKKETARVRRKLKALERKQAKEIAELKKRK